MILPTLLCPCEMPPGGLCAVFGCPSTVRADAKEGHKNDLLAETPLLLRKAVKAEAV